MVHADSEDDPHVTIRQRFVHRLAARPSGHDHPDLMEPARNERRPRRPNNLDDTPTSPRSYLIHGWGELIALIPYQFGFIPRGSIVLAGLGAGEGPVGPLIRLDHGMVSDERPIAVLADRLMRDGVQHLAIVDFGDGRTGPDDHRDNEDWTPDVSVLRTTRRVCRRAGLAVIEMVVVSDRRWAVVDVGRDVNEIAFDWEQVPDDSTIPAIAESIVTGHAVLESRAELGRMVSDTGLEQPGHPDVIIAAAHRPRVTQTEGRAAWRRLLADPRGCAPEDLAVAASALADVPFRDAMLEELITLSSDRGLGVAIIGRGQVIDLMHRIKDVPVKHRAALATVAALLAWSRGWGPLAATAITVVERVDPDYRLGRLTARLVDQLVPPPLTCSGERPGKSA